MDTINEYLKSTEQSAYAFSKKAGVPWATFWRIWKGIGTPRPGPCLRIEKASDGVLKASTLIFKNEQSVK